MSDPTIDFFFLISLVSTILLTGISWFLQLVHYPLLPQVGLESSSLYFWRQRFLWRLLMLPLLLAEGGSALYLSSAFWEASLSFHMNIGVILAVIAWVSTFVFLTPILKELIIVSSPGLIRQLIAFNVIPTIAWTLRSGLMIWLLKTHF